MLFRGFANVHTRLLLNLQAEIQYLETELDDLDELLDDKGQDFPDERLQSWKHDAQQIQKEKQVARERKRGRDAQEKNGECDARGGKREVLIEPEGSPEQRTRQDVLNDLYRKISEYGKPSSLTPKDLYLTAIRRSYDQAE